MMRWSALSALLATSSALQLGPVARHAPTPAAACRARTVAVLDAVEPHVFDAAFQLIAERAPPDFSGVTKAIDQATPVVKGAVDAAAPVVQKAVTDAIPVIEKSIEDAKPVLAKTASDLEPVLKQGAEVVGPVLLQGLTAAGSALLTTGVALGKTAVVVGGQLATEAGTTLSSEVTKAVAEKAATVDPSQAKQLNDVVGGLSSAAKTTADIATPVLAEGVKALTPAAEQASTALGKLAKDEVRGLLSWLDTVVSD